MRDYDGTEESLVQTLERIPAYTSTDNLGQVKERRAIGYSCLCSRPNQTGLIELSMLGKRVTSVVQKTSLNEHIH